LSWSNGISPFPLLNSAKIATCLVVSRLYEITAEIVTLYLNEYITPPYIDFVSTSTIYVLDSRSCRNRYGLLGSLTPEPLFVKQPDPNTTPLRHHLCAYYVKRIKCHLPRDAYLLCLTTTSATWRWPAQFVNSRKYGTGRDQWNAQLSVVDFVLSLSLATASATWRRPAQRVYFIFGDGQRNLATAAATATATAYLLSLATAGATWRRPAQFVNSR